MRAAACSCARALSALVLFAFGCASAEPQPVKPPPVEPVVVPPPAPDPEQGRAPTPYTVEQLRAATPEGRNLTYVIEAPPKLPMQKRFRFLAVDDERATLLTELLDDNGKVIGQPEQSSPTWNELRMHSSYPQETTTIVEISTETPAGSFHCKRYTVLEKIEEGEKRTVACFAKELPGPPVELTVELNGNLLMSMSLLHFWPELP